MSPSRLLVVLGSPLLVLAACGTDDSVRADAGDRGAARPSHAETDREYCELYTKRLYECFPLASKSDGEPPETYEARCFARFEQERAAGTFDASERMTMERCLAKPDCDAVTACMHER